MADDQQRAGGEATVVIVVVAEDMAPSAVGSGAKGTAKAVEAASVAVDVATEPGGHADKDGGKDPESERTCRICHLRSEGSELFELGCGCKGDLGIAHRHCAETWFMVKGNRFCEICGANAKNITGENDSKFMDEWYERGESSNRDPSERCSCWRQQPFCNFLMACLVIAFILPWFFRVNMF